MFVAARRPRAADLLPRIATPQPPPPTADDALRPPARATIPDATHPSLTPPTEESPLALHEVLRDVQLDAATIHVRWLPSTEVFDFPTNGTTTVFDLKAWLAGKVRSDAPPMHVGHGVTQLRDEAPLSQYIGHGDTVLARTKQ